MKCSQLLREKCKQRYRRDRHKWKMSGKSVEKDDGQPKKVRVDIEYCNVCNSKPQCLELSQLIKDRIPEAQVACKIGRRGSFEVQINDTLVHSKLNSLAFPDYEAVVSNVISARDGRPVAKVKEQPITDCVVQ